MRIGSWRIRHEERWISSRTKDIEEIKKSAKEHKMKDLGIARRFPRMDIEYGDDGSIKLYLKRYLETLL
jgi:hypothetical protein